MRKPRNIQTFLPDGTLEGLRVIEVSESSVKAVVVPRVKINDTKKRSEINQPALYLLINSGDNQIYIGESENFLHRIKTHDQSKKFWDIAVAVVSSTNNLEKSDIKYLESLAVEKAKATAAMEVLNKTIPSRNNIHEFKVHSLEAILEDTALIMELLGFSVFATKKDQASDVWYCVSKKTNARAEFRGGKFIVLSGSVIDKSTSERWERVHKSSMIERVVRLSESATENEETYTLTSNIPFSSPSRAGGFVTGRNVNGWTLWKDNQGRTMDEVIRQSGNYTPFDPPGNPSEFKPRRLNNDKH